MITKELLAKELRKPGLSYRDASVYLDAIVGKIIELLSNGESIQIRGFGTFSVTKHAARRTGIAQIPEHNRVFFRPSGSLRKAVWNGSKKKAVEKIEK